MHRSMGESGHRFDPRGHRYVTGEAWATAPAEQAREEGTMAEIIQSLRKGLSETWETTSAWAVRNPMLLVGIAALSAGLFLGGYIERKRREQE